MSSLFAERLEVNEAAASSLLYNEHLSRYELASQYVKDKIVLDAACGSGYGAKMLAAAGAAKVLAVDLDERSVAAAIERYGQENIEFLVDNVETLSKIADESVAVAVSFETIEHLSDSEALVRQLKRVLAPNGLAIVSTPNREVFGQKNPYHLKEFTRGEFIAALGKYFKNVVILEQYNVLASVIDGGAEKTAAAAEPADKALYFIALAGDGEIKPPVFNIVSLNQQALINWQNNPVWRLANGLYALLVNIGIIK